MPRTSDRERYVQADAIVTFNKRDFVPASAQFGLQFLSPGEAVRYLEKRQ
jgi:hypothetical protein